MLKGKLRASNGYTTKKKKRLKTRDTSIYIKNLKNNQVSLTKNRNKKII